MGFIGRLILFFFNLVLFMRVNDTLYDQLFSSFVGFFLHKDTCFGRRTQNECGL